MNKFNRKLKEASEFFLSIRLSLLLLTAQLLAELILVSELIGLFGGYLGIFPNFEFDGVKLLRLIQNAWILNLCYMLSLKMNYTFESIIPENVPQIWLLRQEQIETSLGRIPSLSLAKLSLDVGQAFANTVLLKLYVYFCSQDYKYLIRLTKTDTERSWAYFLALDLFEYSLDKRLDWLLFFLFFFERKYVLERIYLRLEDEAIELSIRERAIEYVNQLGIPNSVRRSELSAPLSEEPENIPNEIPHDCYGCTYLYGKVIHGKLLVCAIHPYGLDDCPDLEVIPTIALTHKNCQLPNFYGVRTNMSLEDLKKAIAYLQILRARLPKFKTVEDSLYPDTVVELLARFYECAPIVSPSPFPVDSTIDIGDNWNNYTCSTEQGLLNQRVARAGAVKAILIIMYSQAYVKADYREIVLILELMLQGYFVPAQWGLKTPFGKPYTGALSLCDLDDEPDLG